MRFKFVAFAGAVSFLMPVVAQADDAVAPAPKKEKKICHLVAVTGSIVGTRRTCLTAAEWVAVKGQTAASNAKGVEMLDSARPMGTNPFLK
jgi:hypothetical protein